jgi:anhydro-N-acetylmuramic acid kinase
MLYIGLMSGTSADAIDAALLRLPPGGGFELLATHAHPLPAELKNRIAALCEPGAGVAGEALRERDRLDELGALDTRLGELFAQAALALLAKTGHRPVEIRAIGSHGQTLRHRPAGADPFTLQLGNPAVIAERTGITTVADFRRRDLAAGGQGAPLAPAFHAFAFRAARCARAILNIGGIANLTYLPAGESTETVLGFDTGPGNTLLDQWIRRTLGEDYDRDGAWAAGGRPQAALLEVLLADPYFRRLPPKSTGREYFHLGWLERALAHFAAPPSPQDVQATLLALTARSIAQALREYLPPVGELFVCGGGAHNRALLARLAEELPGIPVRTTDSLGLAPDWVEAAAFAWLAHRTLEGLPGNLPSVTGAARAVILGGIYKA